MYEFVEYGAIYADPPWHWRAHSDRGTGRGAVSHYDLMDLDAIKALEIPAADDCALFLWAINSMLPQALEVVDAWGFTFKTVAFTWVKTNTKSDGYFTGMGYWTRCNPEQCLLATRGRPKRLNRDVRQLMFAPRREHSRKPDEIRTSIERLVPGPYLELFARESAPGWDVWGDQAGLFDAGHVDTRRQPSRLAYDWESWK